MDFEINCVSLGVYLHLAHGEESGINNIRSKLNRNKQKYSVILSTPAQVHQTNHVQVVYCYKKHRYKDFSCGRPAHICTIKVSV